jgi:AraC-like DNA-binding protein
MRSPGLTLLPRSHIAVHRIPALGGIDLIRARFQAVASPLHCHGDVEIGMIVSGRRQVRVRGRDRIAPAGSIFVFHPGEVHAGKPLDDRSSTYRAFLVPAATLRELAGWPADLEMNPPGFDAPIRDRELAARFVLAHRALTVDPADSAAARRLIIALAALAHRHQKPGPGLVDGIGQQGVRRVRQFLDVAYAEKVRLDSLARLADMSQFHLIRVFRTATGLTPYAYLEQVRVNRAVALLRRGTPVSRTAFLTGFADQSHLTRFFKRLTGVPPGQYRRSALRSTLRPTG